MRYRKKPVIIEAIQWDGTLDGINYIQRNFNVRTVCCEILGGYLVKHWSIETLEGSYVVSPRDYIIKGNSSCGRQVFLPPASEAFRVPILAPHRRRTRCVLMDDLSEDRVFVSTRNPT